MDPASGRDEMTDVLVHGSLIVRIGPMNQPSADTEIIDASGWIVAPGLVDMHVHLREPGFEYKETIAGATEAAVAGGVTSVAAMPNTDPPIDDITVVRYVLEKASLTGKARVFPIGAVSKGRLGREITEMGLLKKAGCVAFSDDGEPVMDSGVMRRAMEYSRTFDALIIQHAEDINLVGHGCMNEGVTSARLGLPGIPTASEDVLVERDIRLAELTGGRYHVAHISSARAVDAVRKARARGLPVSCEAAPHHFALTDEAVGNYDTNAKMAPPLRSDVDMEAIRAGLADGTIEVIATDHAPHDIDAKQVEFCKAAVGVVGLETLLPVSLELVRDGVLDLQRCLAAMTCNPARLLRIDAGTLREQGPADIVLFDPEQAWTVDAHRLHGNARNTCFHGRRVRGRVKRTLVNGIIQYVDDM
jgi:dihydroorotase